jgi:radical SAM protein with 4Fe4S-binding SPASM domain
MFTRNLSLIENPRIVHSDDKSRCLTIFPSQPFWFAVEGEIKPLLNLFYEGGLLSEIALRYSSLLGISNEEATHKCQELTQLLHEGGVLLVDGERSKNTVFKSKDWLTPTQDVCVISLTMACNLRCNHCFIDSFKPLPDELNTSEIYSVIDQVCRDFMPPPSVQPFIHFTGGEAFLRKDIEYLIRYARSRGLYVSISTNGLCIKEETMDFLAEQQVVCSVSLDGMSAQTHEMVRGSNTFDLTIKAIRNMTSKGVRVGINHFVHKDNFHELVSTLELARELGVEGFNPIPLEQLGRARTLQTFEAVPDWLIYRTLFDFARSRPWVLELLKYSSPLANMVLAVAAGMKSTYCGVGTRKNLFVQSNGDVYPCANTCHPALRLGNTRETPLIEIYNNTPTICEMRNLHVDTMNSFCSKCDIRYFCGGDCRGETFANCGSLNARSINCKERKKGIFEVMWILTEYPNLFSDVVNEVIDNVKIRSGQGNDKFDYLQ